MPSSRPRPTRRPTAAPTPGSARSSTSRPRPSSCGGDVRSCAIVSERADLTAALTAALEAQRRSLPTVTSRRATSTARPSALRRHRRRRPGPSTPSSWPWPGTPPAAPPPRPPAAGRPSWPTTAGSSSTSTPTPPGPEPSPTRRRSRTSRAARHAHRRHDARRPEPGPGLGPDRPCGRRRNERRRVTALATSLESSERRTRPHSRANWSAHLLAHPEAGALAGAELVVGPGWLGLRAHPRPIGTVVYGGPAIPGVAGRRAARDRRRHRRRPREHEADDRQAQPRGRRRARPPLGSRSDRLVPVPHAPGRLGQEGITKAARACSARFDADTYRAESARWNVEKFVNVAAATGPNSVDETLELDRNAGDAGRSHRHHRGPPADRDGGRGRRAPRPPDAAATIPGRPPHGSAR